MTTQTSQQINVNVSGLSVEEKQRVNEAGDEIIKLRAEVERLRMQLAACGVVAMANTPESANKARAMHPEYMSASCQDVMEAVDREMALRDQMTRQADLIHKMAGMAKQGHIHPDQLGKQNDPNS